MSKRNVATIEAATLGLIQGGEFADRVNKAIRDAAANTLEHGEDEKARNVVIKLEMSLTKQGNIMVKSTVKPTLIVPPCFEKCSANADGDLFFGVKEIEGETEDDRDAA